MQEVAPYLEDNDYLYKLKFMLVRTFWRNRIIYVICRWVGMHLSSSASSSGKDC